MDAAGFWQQFETDWICLDAELMPWSAKAQELLRQQYAAVGAAESVSYGNSCVSGASCIEEWRCSASHREI